MKLRAIMQFLRDPDALQKLLAHEWSFPSVLIVRPWFFAFVGGILLASLVGLGAGYRAIPTITQTIAPDVTPQAKNIVFSPPIVLVESEVSYIRKRNLFNSDGGMADESGEAKCDPKKSTLALKFTGIIYGGTAETSLVVIENTLDKSAATLLVGQGVPGDAIITDIQAERVFLKKETGCSEYLDLEAAPLPIRRMAGKKLKKLAPTNSSEGFEEPGFSRKGEKVETSREYLMAVITKDIAKTLQDAKASPHMVNGQIKGFGLSRIKEGSIYEKIGLQNGDIVVAINGIELTSAPGAVQTLNAMRNESSLEILVERNGQQFAKTVNVR